MHEDGLEIKINENLLDNFISICQNKKVHEEEVILDLINQFLENKIIVSLVPKEDETKKIYKIFPNEENFNKIISYKERIHDIIEVLLLDFVNDHIDEQIMESYFKNKKIKK